ncbi:MULTISPECIES: DUF6397 family protein [Streptomyces]|uniref:DUF6397 family protein n=1 Tax=Streptomyces TaxID=1883 RepID=UPI00163C47D2|nr:MULTISPECIES: DUF6397 family protein [Streptomyces]MBC2876290.1 hypothetical protein [Streptomyces sp. TYQ1024]UBI35491.1 DUF6397 family protein [Streptomyces mobaraensis]UKW28083.1 DUF6397 family protein [Streptomyces sp. TYQ1024]
MADRCTSGSAAENGVPFGRAARELGLKVGELDLAVQLGEVRTVASGPEGPRRVLGEDIERHRSAEGFPDALRARLRTVGTAEGAELAGIAPARFTRLARGGLLVPVRFWINRYGAVVWRYLASDVAEFAERRPALLTGRLPADLRAATDDGGDRRGMRWRGLRVEQLEAQAGDPWRRAAAPAAVLSPDLLVPAVPDPVARAWLGAHRPALTSARPSAPAGRAAVEGLVFADGPDEVAHYQARVAALTAVAQRWGAPPGPESARSGETAYGVAAAVGGGSLLLVPSSDAPPRTESVGRGTADAAPGERVPLPAPTPAPAGGPGAGEREQAAATATAAPAAGGAASDPRPSGGTRVPRAGRDVLGAGVPAQPAAPGGLRSVWRVLDRLLARGGRPGASARRERSAGWSRTVPGLSRRRRAGRPARRCPADVGARRRSASGRISGRP